VTWGQSDLHDVVVQLRVKDRSGDWGRWTTLAPDDVEQSPSAGSSGGDVRGGTAPYWTDDAFGIEVIVQGEGGLVPKDVKVALVDPGTSAADKLPVESGAPDQAHAGATMPDIITRAQWGADESIRTWDPEYAPTIKAATLHHTADRNSYTAAEVPGMLRAIYAYHAQTRGWGDIGYNVIVDKFGRIFEGRYGGLSSTVIGAHAGGFNYGTFGVSMLGNYSEVDHPPGAARLRRRRHGVEALSVRRQSVRHDAADVGGWRDGEVRRRCGGHAADGVRPPGRRQHDLPGGLRLQPHGPTARHGRVSDDADPRQSPWATSRNSR
jgi:hypothetical protein